MLEKKTLSYVIVSSYHWDSHKLKNSNIQVNNPYVRVQGVTNENYISVSICLSSYGLTQVKTSNLISLTVVLAW